MNAIKEAKERKRIDECQRPTLQPAIVIRRGAVAASIWVRQTPAGRPFYDFSLSRSWKSLSTKNSGYSKNFFADQAEELVEVIREAALWIDDRKREDPSGTLLSDEALVTAALPAVGQDFTVDQLVALENEAQRAIDQRHSEFQASHRSYPD